MWKEFSEEFIDWYSPELIDDISLISYSDSLNYVLLQQEKSDYLFTNLVCDHKCDALLDGIEAKYDITDKLDAHAKTKEVDRRRGRPRKTRSCSRQAKEASKVIEASEAAPTLKGKRFVKKSKRGVVRKKMELKKKLGVAHKRDQKITRGNQNKSKKNGFKSISKQRTTRKLVDQPVASASFLQNFYQKKTTFCISAFQ